MNSKYNYNDAQVPEPKYDTDTANKYYVDKVAKQLSGDIEGDISGIATDIATKSKNYTSAPNPPYNVGDTYMNGDDIYICITSRGYGSFTQADWKLASNYDNTQDVIDGGITTTQGTFIVTDSAGATAAGLTAYGTGDNNVRIWAGSSIGNRNSAPFRVTQGGALYANNATIEGTITSTNANIKGIIKADSGTLGAWTINAYKIYNEDAESGNACCIQYPNYEYQSGKFTNWVFAAGATDHTGYGDAKFRVNKAGAMYATSGQIGGWEITSDRLYNSNNGIYANGEFYMYPTAGGILALNNAFRCKGPSGIAIYNNLPNYGTSDTINAGISIMGDSGNVTIGNRSSAYGVNIRSYISSKTVANATNGGMLLAAANAVKIYSNNDNIYMDAVNGAIWAHGNGLSNSKVKTDAGSSSSRNVKTNFKKFNQDKYDKALSLLNKMNLYDYDYKYNIYKNPHQYGFIIDELEQLEETKDFFEFEEYNATVDGEKIDFSGTMEGEKLKTKNYDSDVLDKYLLTCIKALLNKVEVLENKINEMEENK